MAKEPKAAAGTPEAGAPGKPAAAAKRKKEFKKKREKRVVPHGVVYIAATFNNTQITISASRARARARPTPRNRLRSWLRVPLAISMG